MKDEPYESPKSTPNSKPKSTGLVDMYAAQCHDCLKWRAIATEEEYEDIRSETEKFTCKSKDLTCDSPADIEYNASRTWVIDKPGVPRTPRGFRRHLVLRGDYSKMDAYYITPTGKKLRTRNEIAAFVVANPEYKYAKLDDFNFGSPKVMEDTIPEDAKTKAASSNSKKKSKIAKVEA